MTVFDTVTETFPLFVLFANIPAEPFPSIAPVAVTSVFPIPAFSAIIPADEPVTAFAVIVKLVPLADVFLT